MIRLNIGISEAIKISHWLKEQGYEHDEDYIWYKQSSTKQIVFICKKPEVETLLALKF